MKLGYDLSLKQKQKLVMTNQLIQSINILQFNSMELGDYINEELEKNPLLEREENPAATESSDINWLEFVRNAGTSYESTSTYDEDDDDETRRIENVKCTHESLKEMLVSQLHMLDLSDEDYYVGEFIIDFIDERGYLCISPEEISQITGIVITQTIKVLNLIRRFEPSGIGGMDLKECLKIQLINANYKDELLFRVLDEHLEDLAYSRDQKIMKDVDISGEKLVQYREILKTLDPKPGMKYSNEEPDYVVPDIFVELVNDEVKVHMNDYYVPQLKINNYYVKILENNDDAKATEFIKNSLNSASFVINSILQRRNTIQSIAEELFKRQKEFLKYGDSHIKPMNLKEIASNLGIHESTVSRAIKNKYAVTPKGIYSLKFFFTTGMASDSGEDVSVRKIKEVIKEHIARENKKKPLSDQNLADILADEGYRISRRTVTKYRESLHIMSTRERKG
ncbi:MAG: RNA polymerase factor sigma-54 [Eubacteriaceae bacterium]|nr:RNA polymerase factor sigma-54 [Eubacteriaceae bacterium]